MGGKKKAKQRKELIANIEETLTGTSTKVTASEEQTLTAQPVSTNGRKEVSKLVSTESESAGEDWTEERYMRKFGDLEPLFSDSDVERGESLKVSVPTLPEFVSLEMESKSIRKVRRVRTTMDGLFVYSGRTCVYWPAVHELPKEYPVKEELLRISVAVGDDRMFENVVAKYEKYYTLWHLYGAIFIYANDNDDLVKNFTERLNSHILEISGSIYQEGIIPGCGNSWKANMIDEAKLQDPHPCAPLKLRPAKLLKKPFIEVKYNESRRRTDRVGPWKDDPESDPESRASPPRYRTSRLW